MKIRLFLLCLLVTSLTMLSIAPAFAQEPVLGPSDVSDKVAYYIYTTARGGLTVEDANATGIVGTSEAGVGQTIDPTDPRQQFLFVNKEDKLYLYNMATQKFLGKGTAIKGLFTDEPVDPILFKNAGNGTVMLYFDDDHNINLGGSKQVTIDDWNTKDKGNSFIINVACPIYTEPVLSKADVSDKVSYYIYTTERGGLTVKDANATGIVGTSESGINQSVDPTDPRQQFVFVNWQKNLYLYNVATQKFLGKGTTIKGLFTDEPVDPILFKNAGNGTVMLYFDDDHNINLGGQKQVTIDKWSDKDPGNSFIIKVAERFDQAPIIELLDNDEYSGKCGENLTWTLKHGTLTISGTGDMGDLERDSPWYQYRNRIYNIIIGSGVTSIGDFAFIDCIGLTSITIPNSVTSIGYAAFDGCGSLASVAIPNSVTSIDDEAFRGCSSLTSMTIPNSVTSIGAYAFSRCSSLTTFTIPNSVTTIEQGTFYDCYNLTSITIPHSVTSIGGYVFKNCISLTSVTIPNSVKEITNSIIHGDSFSGCSALKEVNISCIDDDDFCQYLSRTDIESVFHCLDLSQKEHNIYVGGEMLTSIRIPNSVTSIGNYAFKDCSSLASVTIPNSVTRISEGVFYGCSSLTSVTIPNSVTSIGAYAFKDCSSLTSVTIPNSVTSIGDGAFQGCDGLTVFSVLSFNPPSASSSILQNAGTKIVHVYEGFAYVYRAADGWKSYTIVDDITNPYSQGVEPVLGPTDVSNQVSYYIYTTERGGLTVRNANATGIVGTSEAGVGQIVNPTDPRQQFLFVNWEDKLYLYNVATKEFLSKGTTIKGRFTSVPVDPILFKNAGDGTVMLYFDDDHNINIDDQKQVTIDKWSDKDPGNSFIIKVAEPFDQTPIIEYLDNDAFSGKCGENLTWTLKHGTLTISGTGDMYDYKFYDGVGLTPWGDYRELISNVIIDDGVTSLSYVAFYRYSKLSSVIFPNSLVKIGDYALGGCSSLTSVTIPNSVTKIGDGAFYGCSSLTSVTIPNSVTSIGSDAFTGCNNVKTLIYAEGCKEALRTYLTSIKSITIPNSVTGIGWDAFDGCSSLEEVNISCVDNDDFINYMKRTDIDRVFHEVGLAGKRHNIYIGGELCTAITIPNSVTSIENNAFNSCSSLTSVTIPNSVTYIAYNAFQNCSSLASINIPNSIKSIGQSAFKGCSALTSSVTIPNSVTFIGAEAFSGCDNVKTLIYAEGATKLLATGLTSIESVTIPNTVMSVEKDVFKNCSSLNEVNISCIDNDDFIKYMKRTDIPTIFHTQSLAGKNHNIYIGSELCTAITIPNSVLSIGDYAFADCPSLTSTTIPNSVTSIGNSAFKNCTSLISVTIPSVQIDESVFEGCSNVRTLVYAEGCKGVLPTYLTSIENVEIPNSVKSISDGAFKNCILLFSVEIPNSVTNIGKQAFYGCSSLETINIPNSVTLLGEDLCNGCSYISELTIGDGVEVVPARSFKGCSLLKKVVIGESVREIESEAFAGCARIVEIDALPVVPPTCESSAVFDSYVYKAAMVYVPSERNAIGRYRAEAVWKDFFDIAEREVVAIGSVTNDTDSVSNVYYNLQGQRNIVPTHGINIINGKKTLVR